MKTFEIAKLAHQELQKQNWDKAWKLYSTLCKKSGIENEESNLHIFQDAIFVLGNAKKLPPTNETSKILSLAKKIAPDHPTIFDNLAGYYFHIGQQNLGYHFLEQGVKYGYFKNLNTMVSPKTGYPELKNNKFIYAKLKHLFHALGSDKINVGDLVSDKEGKWGIIFDKDKKGELGILYFGWYGGLASVKSSQCRKIRKANTNDLREIKNYHDNNLHNEFIDMKKVLKNLADKIK